MYFHIIFHYSFYKVLDIVLCSISRTLLFIYFIYVLLTHICRVWLFATPRTVARQAPLSMGLYLLFLYTFSFGSHKFAFSIWESCFCFVNKFICILFSIPYISKKYCMIFVFLCLTSFSMLMSRSIHVAANGIISFVFMAGWYSITHTHTHIYNYTDIHHYMYIYMYINLIKLSISSWFRFGGLYISRNLYSSSRLSNFSTYNYLYYFLNSFCIFVVSI